MLAVAVSVIYWSLLSLITALSVGLLIGTIWRNMQFSTARVQVDDGSEDPASASFRIYRLSLTSGALAVVSAVTCLPLLAGGILAFAGSTLPSAAAAFGLATVSLIVADMLRERHLRCEKEFHRLSGKTIQELHAQVLGRLGEPHASSRDDQSVTSV